MIAIHRKSWTPLDVSVLLLMIGVGIWSFRSPLRDIAALALKDDEQSHILLAPIIALWLVWVRRSRLALLGAEPNLLGPALVAIGAAACWWGFHSDTFLAWHGGAVLALLGMLVAVTGPALFRQLGPAVLALAFLIPVPGAIRTFVAVPLQSVASNVTYSCLSFLGMQPGRMGNVLIINGEQVAVAEACNGMRLVFALTLVVFAFVFSTQLRNGTRLTLLLLSPFIALVANILRLVPTSVLYGVLSPQHAHLFHDIAGWLMLPLTLLALLAMLRVFRWLDLPLDSYRLAYR